jgi:hypothetical protein
MSKQKEAAVVDDPELDELDPDEEEDDIVEDDDDDDDDDDDEDNDEEEAEISMRDLCMMDSVPEHFELCGNDFYSHNDLITEKPRQGREKIPNAIGALCPIKHLPMAARLQLRDKQVRRIVACCADENYSALTESMSSASLEDSEICTFSFSVVCLARLMFVGGDVAISDFIRTDKVLSALAKGTIQVLDFDPDKTIAYSGAEKRRKKPENNIPPAPGYTAINAGWHRPATVLLRNTRTKQHYLMGIDDGQYFGCVLAGKPRTVQHAYSDLVPKVAQEVAGVQRQGEWFVVPVKEKHVPAPPKGSPEICLLRAILPKEDPDSNDHTIEIEEGSGNTIRVVGDRIYARDGELLHSQHPRLTWAGWVMIVRNTAVRSVSVEGVD